MRPATGPTRPPRVVVADPDDAARARTVQVLTDAGCAVVAAVGSHAQAVVATRTHRPDVLVVELRGGQILTAPAYIEALRGQCPSAAIVVYATDLPSPDVLSLWRVAAGLVKVVDAARLPAVVVGAPKVRHAAP